MPISDAQKTRFPIVFIYGALVYPIYRLTAITLLAPHASLSLPLELFSFDFALHNYTFTVASAFSVSVPCSSFVTTHSIVFTRYTKLYGRASFIEPHGEPELV